MLKCWLIDFLVLLLEIAFGLLYALPAWKVLVPAGQTGRIECFIETCTRCGFWRKISLLLIMTF